MVKERKEFVVPGVLVVQTRVPRPVVRLKPETFRFAGKVMVVGSVEGDADRDFVKGPVHVEGHVVEGYIRGGSGEYAPAWPGI